MKAATVLQSIPEAVRLAMQWRKIQLQAKDATIEEKDAAIQAREARLDVVAERLVLEREKAQHDAQVYESEIEKLRGELERTEVGRRETITALSEVLQRVVQEVASKTGTFAEGQTRVAVAFKIRDNFYLRGERGVAGAVRFLGDVALLTVQEIRQGSEQLLELLGQVQSEEYRQMRDRYEKLRTWAQTEEERLSKIHQLPSAKKQDQAR